MWAKFTWPPLKTDALEKQATHSMSDRFKKKKKSKKANCRKKHQTQQGRTDRESMGNIQKMETCKLRTWRFIGLKWECNHNFGRKTKNKIRTNVFLFSPTDAERCRRYTLRSSSPSSLLRRSKKQSCFSEEAEGKQTNYFLQWHFKKGYRRCRWIASSSRLALQTPPRLGRRPRVAPSQALNKKPLLRLVDK